MDASVTDDTFPAEVLASPIPVMVDFWAPWCGPCKTMLPVMEELATAYAGKAKILKMNVDENAEIPGQHGVMSIPTFIIFKGGEPVRTIVGVHTKEDMQEALDAVL